MEISFLKNGMMKGRGYSKIRHVISFFLFFFVCFFSASFHDFVFCYRGKTFQMFMGRLWANIRPVRWTRPAQTQSYRRTQVPVSTLQQEVHAFRPPHKTRPASHERKTHSRMAARNQPVVWSRRAPHSTDSRHHSEAERHEYEASWNHYNSIPGEAGELRRYKTELFTFHIFIHIWLLLPILEF